MIKKCILKHKIGTKIQFFITLVLWWCSPFEVVTFCVLPPFVLTQSPLVLTPLLVLSFVWEVEAWIHHCHYSDHVPPLLSSSFSSLNHNQKIWILQRLACDCSKGTTDDNYLNESNTSYEQPPQLYKLILNFFLKESAWDVQAFSAIVPKFSSPASFSFLFEHLSFILLFPTIVSPKSPKTQKKKKSHSTSLFHPTICEANDIFEKLAQEAIAFRSVEV